MCLVITLRVREDVGGAGVGALVQELAAAGRVLLAAVGVNVMNDKSYKILRRKILRNTGQKVRKENTN